MEAALTSMPASRHTSQSQVLAVTSGDPAGIGLDITLNAWTTRDELKLPPFVLYGDVNATQHRAAALKLNVPITRVSSPAVAPTLFPASLPVIDIPLHVQPIPGQPQPINGQPVLKAIEQAVTDVSDGLAGAIVTNPISKTTLYDAGFKFPGHTEYLAHLCTRLATNNPTFHPVMMLASEELRVVPLTIHIPLRNVPGAITSDLIVKTATITRKALQDDFGFETPRLAVTGLNPHAGENNALGTEDNEIIRPAIEHLKQQGFYITGPHPADTLFHAKARKTYDAVIAMYHDQALIPIKTLAFDKGVNVTLGLPIIRTSPDHGTAFDIAGSGLASPDSLIESLHLGAKISQRRFLSHSSPPL